MWVSRDHSGGFGRQAHTKGPGDFPGPLRFRKCVVTVDLSPCHVGSCRVGDVTDLSPDTTARTKNPCRIGQGSLGSYWRRRGDSNPRTGGYPVNGFRDRRIQPLCHPSAKGTAPRGRREYVAESWGFEPQKRLNTAYTISNRAPSTSRPALHQDATAVGFARQPVSNAQASIHDFRNKRTRRLRSGARRRTWADKRHLSTDRQTPPTQQKHAAPTARVYMEPAMVQSNVGY